MKSLRVKGELTRGNETHSVETPILIFQEEGTWFYYSPALDLTGYGMSTEEAENSYSIALEELLKYTINKNTFKKVLVDLGWKYTKLSKKSKMLSAPPLAQLLSRDEYLQDIFNNKEYHKVNKKVELPVLA